MTRPHTTGDSDLVEPRRLLGNWLADAPGFYEDAPASYEIRQAVKATLSYLETQAAEIERLRDELKREHGWLIEEPAREGYGPRWLRAYTLEEPSAKPGFWMSPTANAGEALRFARKCDADVFLHNMRQLHPGLWDHCITTDHSWVTL